jgi:hypothetical protein
MTDQCPAIEVLIDIDELPIGDPGRAHLDDCPRCQARLADYRDFMDGGAEVPADELETAMNRLEAALAVEIHPDVKPFRAASRPLLMRPAVRGALALAALLLIVIAVNGLWQRPRNEKIRLRAPETESVGAVLELLPPERLATGGLKLSWSTFPDADDYELLLMAPDLSVLTTLTSDGQTQVTLTTDRLEALFADERIFAWRVRALAGGDPIGDSEPASCRLAPRP